MLLVFDFTRSGYFRGFRGRAGNASGITLSDFKFWRGSLGVSFKF